MLEGFPEGCGSRGAGVFDGVVADGGVVSLGVGRFGVGFEGDASPGVTGCLVRLLANVGDGVSCVSDGFTSEGDG